MTPEGKYYHYVENTYLPTFMLIIESRNAFTSQEWARAPRANFLSPLQVFRINIGDIFSRKCPLGLQDGLVVFEQRQELMLGVTFDFVRAVLVLVAVARRVV